jgi:hypothetical protein
MTELFRALSTKAVCGNCGLWRFLCGCVHEVEREWVDGEARRCVLTPSTHTEKREGTDA